jgi:lysophospholipid acyltransferase (LPLAT)-like uncharacterized protein
MKPAIGQVMTAFLARLMIRSLGATLRIATMGEEHLRAARESSPQGQVIFAFWHGHQFPLVYCWRKRGIAVLSSLSRDGALQSLILGGLGYHIVRGSTSRGAVRGLVGIIRAMKRGRDSGFAVDGPRGPFHEVKGGVLFTALKTGSVIVPITSGVEKSWIFDKAWDRYILPKPFTRTVVAYGQGVMIPPETAPEELDAFGLELGKRLDGLTSDAQAALGRPNS